MTLLAITNNSPYFMTLRPFRGGLGVVAVHGSSNPSGMRTCQSVACWY